MSNTEELVFFPGPFVGHILSAVELAKVILRRNNDDRFSISVSIYIVNPSHLHSAKINAYVDSQSRQNPYPTRLTFVTFPPLSSPLEPSPDSAPDLSVIIDVQKSAVKQVIEDRIKAGLPKPVGFVLYMMCIKMMDIANELHVPSYAFFTCGAASLSMLFYAQSLADDHGVDVTTELSDPGFAALVPGFKYPVTSKVVPLGLQGKEFGYEALLNLARKFREMKGILINTYDDLESIAIQALNEDKKVPHIYPVGPILELGNKSRAGFDIEEESVIQWLDCQPTSSVVFLCFGSMGYFTEAQAIEIAKALDRSGYRFLWALRKPPSEENGGSPNDNETFLEALPEGFIDRMAHRGKIIGWAPQMKVLAHSAVGGFVSHCGWNSTLESLWFGIPMATWPMYAEQQLNAFELVKELELAVEIRMDYKRDWKDVKGNFIVRADEIEEGIHKLMKMDKTMRGNVEKISDDGKKALKEGGSSYNSLGCFIEDIIRNVAY